MKTAALTLAMFTLTLGATAQNENPAPEPVGSITVADMSEWTNPNEGSLDRFTVNSCTNKLQSKSRKMGSIAAKENDRYAGIIASYKDRTRDFSRLFTHDGDLCVPGYGGYAEYVQIELGTPLVAGKEYKISSFMSLAESSAMEVSNLDIMASTEKLNLNHNSFLAGMNAGKMDMSGVKKGTWSEATGKYKAIGGEKFLIIGASQNATANMVIPDMTNNSRQAYYYISSVAIEEYQMPDRDKDGIADVDDKCPDTPGLANFAGCPDSDGDGVVDAEDACPKVKGTAQFKGCPDTDGDGIADNMDKCPTVKGTPERAGCPAVDKKTEEVFARAMEGIFFESGKDIIKGKSFGILNEVVDIMKTHPSYNIDINGYTDSQGREASNLSLSKKRAAAVRKYLTDNGVEASRMESYGFGIANPIGDNATADGRAKNRRVEFKVRF